MSSRNSKKQQAKDLEGSHPQELRREHRQFLVRSVNRNDLDLAALLQLNRSLHKAKAQILESCGELVLLDLGVGRLTLVNDELHLEKSNNNNNNNADTSKDSSTSNGADAATTAAAAPAKTTPLPSDEAPETAVPSSDSNNDTNGEQQQQPEKEQQQSHVVDDEERQNEEDDDDDEEYTLTPAQKDMCVDFLLRMKLRRKLLNRLSRRLNRTAQAMDGVDVSPPPPPRYGDLRLHMDPAAVKAQAERWERQRLAQQRIAASLAAAAAAKAKTEKPIEVAAKENEETSATSTSGDGDETQATEKEAVSTPTPEGATSTEPPTEGDKAHDDAPKQAAEGNEEQPTPMEVDEPPPVAPASASGPEPPASSEEAASTTPADAVAALSTTTTTPTETPTTSAPSGPDAVESASTTNVESKTSTTIATKDDEPPSLQDEYQNLREFEDAYEKIWDKETKTFQYVLAKKQEEVVPDYTSIKAGAGIGAQTRLLSEQERAQEHKRWQTALLTRIPHQATFEELGLKNRVFCLEARRKRCLDEAAEDDDEEDDHAAAKKKDDEPDTKKLKGNPNEDNAKTDDDEEDEEGDVSKEKEADKKGDDSDGSSDMFGDDDDEDDDGKKDEDDDGSNVMKVEETAEKPKKIKLEPRKKKEEEEKEEEKAEEVMEKEPKKMKPMSLAAVPSFYEQDLNRIRAVHVDLLTSSILDHARQQMADATNEYNTAHRLSNQLFEHRNRLQQNLAYFMARSKTELAKANSDYVLQLAIAKQNWLKKKLEHDKNRSQQFLPSHWGRPPFGTNATQNYQRMGGIAGVVGTCIADIVDGAIIMKEGKIPNKKFDDFVPPTSPHTNKQTGETLAQQHRQMETQLKRQMNDITIKLQASEEERQRAWSKMMKTKAEMDPTPTFIPGRRGVRLDVTNYHLVPLPPLRNSTQQAVPREFVSRTAVAAYTPPTNVSTSAGGVEDSKYSIAKVKERISSDGTVRTVQEPKKTKDGLYMRPAGRTRKGMQWDAVRGIWVPEGSQ